MQTGIPTRLRQLAAQNSENLRNSIGQMEWKLLELIPELDNLRAPGYSAANDKYLSAKKAYEKASEDYQKLQNAGNGGAVALANKAWSIEDERVSAQTHDFLNDLGAKVDPALEPQIRQLLNPDGKTLTASQLLENVEKLQNEINSALPKGHRKLKVDGSFGPKTLAALKKTDLWPPKTPPVLTPAANPPQVTNASGSRATGATL